MDNEHYDVIVVGSGAGGSAVAHRLTKAGKRVLLLEKGGRLPRDGSTLDVKTVFAEGKYKNQVEWSDGHGKPFVPGEYYNIGGKTKWYGAALLRMAPHEFEADPGFHCRDWPIEYADLEPYYADAEKLLHVNRFEHEPELAELIDTICGADEGWKPDVLPLGLKKEILDDPNEAKHFDGFASACGYKSDAEWNLLNPISETAEFTLRSNTEVTSLVTTSEGPLAIRGVVCDDGRTFAADTVVLAAGAMTTPRILQNFMRSSEAAANLPCATNVGAYFKLHLNSALLAFSPFKRHDVLRKTAIFFNERFPHSTVQCLGWMDGEILGSQLPSAVPRFVTSAAGERAVGFFVTTEDGSHADNRILAEGSDGRPSLDYDLDRIPDSAKEHDAVVSAFRHTLLHAKLVGVDRYMGIAGSAHALGSTVAGENPADSVVDANGKVHGIDNLYVADGGVLPRSSRVNPALTIYAWGLRLGDHLANGVMK
jgi:choline dehydrogenase-like flavoprotein